MKLSTMFLTAAILAGSSATWAQSSSVDFAEPKSGATVTSPFKVKMVVNGMKVNPAGDMTASTGHHHLIVNGGPIKEGESVPFNDTHLHFGKGQTETELTLAPGKYTLTLQFANGAHQSYGSPMSKTIEVTVK
jgi:hypothetical protein